MTLALVPARGGSKRIHNKNLTDVCGLPMFVWSVLSAKAAGCRVVVSSDSPEILSTAVEHGAEPLVRPEALASDEATLEQVCLHALITLQPDAMLVLQPTSPLRGPDRIRQACGELERHGSVVSLTLDPGAYFAWEAEGGIYWPTFSDRPRTQDLTYYRENGAIYGMTREIIESHGRRYADAPGVVIMDGWESVDVDTHDDLEVARFWMTRQMFRRNPQFAKAAGWHGSNGA